MKAERIICVSHDIERGLGHTEEDPAFARLADKTSPEYLDTMLAIENKMKVKATYNVVGCLFGEVRGRIARDGHCIGFHSYDHRMDSSAGSLNKIWMRFSSRRANGQLSRCRELDNGIKGYRAPQSKITRELCDRNLNTFKFQWFASSSHSLNTNTPKIENGIVKVPILFDDYHLYLGKVKYEEWQEAALCRIKQHNFIAFGFHDCYARFWLPSYETFLNEVLQLGHLLTFDEVADLARTGSL